MSVLYSLGDSLEKEQGRIRKGLGNHVNKSSIIPVKRNLVSMWTLALKGINYFPSWDIPLLVSFDFSLPSCVYRWSHVYIKNLDLLSFSIYVFLKYID